jgi:dynein heavy chain, axonemal
MNKCFEVYKILEDFNYRFSKEDMDKRWMIFGSPKDTMALVEKRKKELEKDELKFEDTMKVEQEDFKDRMENLKRTIGGFHQYQEISQHEEVAQTVKDINNALIEFQDLVK